MFKNKIIIAIFILCLGVFSFDAHADTGSVSMNKVYSEALKSLQESKSGSFDSTVKIKIPKQNNTIQNSLSTFSIPQDITISANGFYDTFDSVNPQINTKISVSAGTFAGDLEIRLKDSTLYGYLSNVSNVMLLSFASPYLNKWFSIPSNPKTNQSIVLPKMPFNSSIDPNTLSKLTDEQKTYISNLTSNANFITIKDNLPTDSINNIPSYHFTFEINKEGIKSYLVSLESYIKSSGKNDSLLSSFDTKNIQSSLDMLKDFNGEAWIGIDDHMLYKISTNFNIGDLNSTNTTNINLVSVFKDWNKSMSVITPVGSVPFQSIIDKGLVQTKAITTDVSIKSIANKLRSQGELFSNTSNSYKGFCRSRSTYGAYNIAKTLPKNSVYKCNDSTKIWASWVKLTTKDYWCIDSTGFAGSISKPKSTNALSCKK